MIGTSLFSSSFGFLSSAKISKIYYSTAVTPRYVNMDVERAHIDTDFKNQTATYQSMVEFNMAPTRGWAIRSAWKMAKNMK